MTDRIEFEAPICMQRAFSKALSLGACLRNAAFVIAHHSATAKGLRLSS